jgi:hypothetical protein
MAPDSKAIVKGLRLAKDFTVGWVLLTYDDKMLWFAAKYTSDCKESLRKSDNSEYKYTWTWVFV